MRRVYDQLKRDNLNPYFPGQHKGICLEPYVVILESTTIPSLTSRTLGQQVIEILIYTPSDSYVNLERHAVKVRKSIQKLDFMRKTGHEGPATVEDDKKAYTKYIEYVLQKKLEV